MTTNTNSMTDSHRFVKSLVLLLGFLVGALAGTALLLAGWLLLTQAPFAAIAGALLGISARTPWYLSRSAGTVAYLLLSGSAVWGLLLSTRIVKEVVPAGLALAMHNTLSWSAVAFTGVHALALLFDNYFSFTLPDLTIPFIGPYRPGWVGAGIIAFYLMLITSVSFRFRQQLGQKRWRRLHTLTFVVFALATLHGVMAGTDSSSPGMFALYTGCGLLVLFLTNYRLLVGRPGRSRQGAAELS